jgi:hypothetical protein
MWWFNEKFADDIGQRPGSGLRFMACKIAAMTTSFRLSAVLHCASSWSR